MGGYSLSSFRDLWPMSLHLLCVSLTEPASCTAAPPPHPLKDQLYGLSVSLAKAPFMTYSPSTYQRVCIYNPHLNLIAPSISLD